MGRCTNRVESSSFLAANRVVETTGDQWRRRLTAQAFVVPPSGGMDSNRFRLKAGLRTKANNGTTTNNGTNKAKSTAMFSPFSSVFRLAT